MGNEEKILDILSSLQVGIQDINVRMTDMDERLTGSIQSMDERLTGNIQSLDERLTGNIQSLDERLTGSIQDLDKRMTDGFEAVDNRLVRIEFKIENGVEVKLGALAEGHSAIMEQMTPRTRIDDMESEIRFLKNVVFQMNEELQALKKAQ